MKKWIKQALCLLGLLMGSSVMAAEIKVIASVAFKDAYLAMQPDFEKATGHRVTTLWLPTVEIMSRLKAGEATDLVIMSSSGIDELTKLGRIQQGSKQNYMKSGIGIGVQRGAVKPDISSAEAVKQALLNAKSVAYSTGPSGVYLVSLLRRWALLLPLLQN